MRPFHHHAPVYYKGHKIGRIYKVKHSKDYMYTLVSVVLYPHDLNLPANTHAVLKIIKRDRHEHDYLDLIYPQDPAQERLSNNSVIDGKVTIDVHSYFSSLDLESLESMKQNAENTISNLKAGTANLNDFMSMLNSIIEENKTNINEATKNLAHASRNTNQLIRRIDTTVSQKRLESTLDNVDSTILNVKSVTQSFTGIGQNIDGTTRTIGESMPLLECAIANATATVSNLNEITSGVKCTLKKPFGGLRLLFGRTINK